MLTVNSPEKFDWANIPLKDCVEGNAMDTYFTFKLFNLLYDKLEKAGRLRIMEEVLVPATSVLAKIEYDGLRVDNKALDNLGVDLGFDIKDLEFNINQLDVFTDIDNISDFDPNKDKLPPSGINIKSSPEMADLLYLEKWGFGLYPIKFSTKTDKPSVDADTLEVTLDYISTEILKRNNGKTKSEGNKQEQEDSQKCNRGEING